MLSYGGYLGILLSCFIIIPALFYVMLFLISKKRLTQIIKMTLRVKEEVRIDTNETGINFHNYWVDIKQPMDSYKMIGTLSLICVIVIILFINGCVVSTEYLTPGDLCPDKPYDCFVFPTKTSTFPSHSFVCNPKEEVLSSNFSVHSIVCYRYILNDQKAVDILGQLGLCTGVMSLSAFVLWFLCWIMSYKRVRYILSVIMISTTIIMLVLFFIPRTIALVTLVLYFLCIGLFVMAIWIMYGQNMNQIHPVNLQIQAVNNPTPIIAPNAN